jgi:hypothetical protein
VPKTVTDPLLQLELQREQLRQRRQRPPMQWPLRLSQQHCLRQYDDELCAA